MRFMLLNRRTELRVTGGVLVLQAEADKRRSDLGIAA
jgi:hypothetical protein